MTDEHPAPRSSPIVLVTSLMLVLGTMLIIVRQMAKPVTNSDAYFHLRMGEEFLSGWSAGDPGSVTRFATADWVPSQWLGQVGLASFESWFGLPGVAWLTGFVVLGFVLVLFLVVRAQSSLVVAAFVLPITVIACAPALSPRPQVFSYLFAAVVTVAWLRLARAPGRVPWWIVPLTWLWATLHGMWVMGLVISLVAAVGIALDRSPWRPPLWKMLLVPLFGGAAAALTPVGPGLYGAVVRVGTITEYFGEWGAPEFTRPATACAALLLMLLAVVELRRDTPMPWSKLALVALAGAFLLYSNRTVPVAAAMLAPLLAGSLQQVLPRRPAARGEVGLVVAGFVVAAIALGLAVPRTSTDEPRQDNAAAQAVAELPAGTGLLNEWNEGGYDLWLFPQLDVVMHGYGDMFTDDELTRNFGMITLVPGWEEDLRDLEVTHALLDSEGKLRHALTTDKGWEVVEEDDGLTYLVAPADWLDASAG